MKRLSVINLQLIFISVIAFVYILYIWQNIIVPFILSLLIASVIVSLSNFIKRFKYVGIVSMPLALAIIWGFFYIIGNLINNNINDVVTKLPKYQAKLVDMFSEYAERFHLNEAIDIEKVLSEVNFSQVLGNAFTSIMDVFSSIWMILFFAVFIIIEQQHFSWKLQKMFTTRIKYNKTVDIIRQIRWDIKSYFVIKAIISFATATLSYVVMRIIGLDFAEFWALLIFILNFIPNIGSIIAVFFPIMLSLVQFDWFVQFIFTTAFLVWIQFLMWNLIEPRYLWNKLNLSPLVILLSLSFWWILWWVIWMLLSVPIIVVINVILSKFKSTRPIAILMSEKGEIK